MALNFNASGFDIGHVFHQHEDGDGWGSGGIARLRSVCNNFTDSNGQLSKASGWSGSYYNVGNDWVNLVAHEFGHQFGANHTFNGSGGSCTDAISKATLMKLEVVPLLWLTMEFAKVIRILDFPVRQTIIFMSGVSRKCFNMFITELVARVEIL